MAHLRRRAVTRLSAFLSLWLILGAVLNIAVAWTLVATDVGKSVFRERLVEFKPPLGPWPRPTSGPWPPPVVHYRFESLGQTVEHFKSAPPPLPAGAPTSDDALDCAQAMHGITAGLPFRGMSVWIVVDYTRQDGHGTRVDGWLPIVSDSGPPSMDMVGVLPILPLWPGFVLNTILYAAVAWALSLVADAARRRFRIRKP